jgi:hypothetical protein
LLRGGAKPGVWAPEECFETAPFFAELARRHFRVEQDIPLNRLQPDGLGHSVEEPPVPMR